MRLNWGLGTSSPARPAIQIPLARLVLAALFALALLPPARPADAAAFTVNSTADEPDASPADGQCRTASGACTLRAAVQQHNILASLSAGTISLPAGTYTLTRTGAGEDGASTGDLDLLGNITIAGAGSGRTVINANGIDRAFEGRPGSALKIQSLTIVGGKPPAGNGGAILAGGTLTVTDSNLDGNAADSDGGAISSAGRLTIARTTIHANQAGDNGGGISVDGPLTLTDTSIDGNTAGRGGGGIIGAQMSITRSAVVRNTAGGLGGGIYSFQNGVCCLDLTNVTVSGNRAADVAGIEALMATGQELLRLNHVTIVRNRTTGTGTGGALPVGAIDAPLSHPTRPSVYMANTVVDENGGPFVCRATMASQGYNAVQPDCVADNGPTQGDIVFDGVGDGAKLGALGLNGGRTPTHLPQAGSPLIDAGNATPAFFPTGTTVPCSSQDQRGFGRPFDGDRNGTARCDIGAVEAGSTSSATGVFELDPTNGTVDAKDPLQLRFGWALPEGQVWRNLKTMDVRLRDGATTALWIRWDEASNTFCLVGDNGACGRTGTPGSKGQLVEGPIAKLDVGASSVEASGPAGAGVVLNLALSFKPHAAGHTYAVEVAATNDQGQGDAFRTAGSLTVERDKAKKDKR